VPPTATPSTGTGTGLTGAYYNNVDFTGFSVVRNDATLNFNWGAGSPHGQIGADTFSVRWTGQIQPRFSEAYTFFTTSDDGVRLWVNNRLIINNWTDHGATQNQGQITLTAGQKYDIKLEYYENGGNATINLEWQSANQARQVVPQTQLYPSATGTALGAAVCRTSANTSVNVSFANNTTGAVDIYWVDYNCQERFYKTLAAGAAYTQQTYLTHVWRVKKQSNGAVLKQVVINNSNPVLTP
jgi:hypothetical protein